VIQALDDLGLRDHDRPAMGARRQRELAGARRHRRDGGSAQAVEGAELEGLDRPVDIFEQFRQQIVARALADGNEGHPRP